MKYEKTPPIKGWDMNIEKFDFFTYHGEGMYSSFLTSAFILYSW